MRNKILAVIGLLVINLLSISLLFDYNRLKTQETYNIKISNLCKDLHPDTETIFAGEFCMVRVGMHVEMWIPSERFDKHYKWKKL